MKQVSNDFLSGIHKTGRRFNNSIQYTINNATRYVLTDKIFRIKFNGYGEIGKTIMMSYEVDCTEDLPEDGLYLIRAGVQSGNYIDWALGSKMYMTDKKYREDKKLYEYTFCDAMVKTMVDFDWGTIVGNYDTITLTTLITSILDYIGFTYSTTGLPNVSTINIKRSQIDGIRLTCRDVLDMALELCGVSLKTIDDNGSSKYVIVDPTATPDGTNTIVVTKDEIIDDMAYTKEKYGPVNSILFESEVSESDNLERKDSTSITNNGLTQYKITGNLLLDNDNRATAIDILYNQLNGFQYYLCDLRTIGFMYVEPLDNINLVLIYGQENYICKVTSDVFTLEDGLEETIQSEKPKQTTEEYIGGSPYDDKKARIDVDKLKGEIVLKTDSNGKISKVRLDSSGDDGSLVEIKADNIKLEGYTTINGNFKIDNYGNMECKNAKLIGGQMTVSNALPDEGYIIFEGTYQSLTWVNNFFLFQQYLHDSNYYRSYTSGYNSVNDYMYVRLRHNVSNDYQAEMIAQSNQAKVKVTKNDYGYGLDAVDGVISISDRKAKDNIKDIDEKKSMNIITKLNPVEFNYKKDEKTHRGLIAQDVVEVLKDNDIEKQVYAYDEEKDLYSLNYIELIPDLINCIKYQQKEIEELKEQIEKLSKK